MRTFSGNHIIYQSDNTRELGTIFYSNERYARDRLVSDQRKMFKLRVNGRFFNFSIINLHSAHTGSTDDTVFFYDFLAKSLEIAFFVKYLSEHVRQYPRRNIPKTTRTVVGIFIGDEFLESF